MNKLIETVFINRLTNAFHQTLVVTQVVDRIQT
ncbi:hypothetical protein D018_2948A, partial [Vibrio parahaemolyticus VP2007-007]